MLRPGRLEAFSDGVFAIAITLLVLDISLPDDAGEDLLRAFLDEWPSYLAYLVSFATVGVAWVRHAVITQHLRGVNTTFVRLNLMLLLLVAFVPFPTGLVADHLESSDPERVAVTILGINLLLVSALISVMWRYAQRHDLVQPGKHDEELQIMGQRVTPVLALYPILIGVGLLVPLAGVFGYLLIALALLLPINLGSQDADEKAGQARQPQPTDGDLQQPT